MFIAGANSSVTGCNYRRTKKKRKQEVGVEVVRDRDCVDCEGGDLVEYPCVSRVCDEDEEVVCLSVGPVIVAVKRAGVK